jgi:hypothetical protein
MPTLVLLWVWFCAYLNCAGWALSALQQLNARGYAVALALGFGALLVWQKKLPHNFFQKFAGENISSVSAGRFRLPS